MVRRALALALVATIGCGPSAEAYPFVRESRDSPDAGTDAGPSDAGPPVVPDEPLEDWDTTGAGPLSGIFAIEVRVPARVVVEVESRQLYRARVLQRDRTIRARIQACRIALPSIEGVADLAFSEGAIRVIERKIVEVEGAYLSAADPIGATFAPPPITVLLGASLASPLVDPLPTAEMPDTALDEDEDGHPGVTVLARALTCRRYEEAYAALRATVGMSGVVTSVDAFDGAVEAGLDQSIVEVSDRCLRAAQDLDVEIQPGASFVARRVGDPEDLDANGNVSCPEIGWSSARLFGEYWVTH